MMAKRDKWGVFMQVLCLGLAFFMLFPILYAVSVSLMEQKRQCWLLRLISFLLR